MKKRSTSQQASKSQRPSGQRGVALLLALVAMLLMGFLASQIASRSALEFESGQNSYEQLKAYHLARIGVEISRLRIYVYRTVVARFGQQLGSQAAQLDMIWQLPFAWPPSLGKDSSSFDKDAIDQAVKKSLVEGAWSAAIEGESGKIDVNDLASPSEGLRKATHQQLVNIIANRLAQDDDWARDNRLTLNPEYIINNIQDYIDEDSESLNGGYEDTYYKNADIKPANRPMKTLEELHLVPGVSDEIYGLLAPRLTVYGVKGINVNSAKAEVLKSLDKQINDDVAAEVIKRRGDQQAGGQFKDENDFLQFLSTLKVDTQTFNKTNPVPLIFDTEYNFRIKSTGIYRRAQREIVAIVYDFGKVKSQLAKLTAPSPSPSPGTGNPGPNPPGNSPAAPPAASPSPGSDALPPAGPPPVVFWQEN